jgi:UDP-N-acetylmuramoyl-tripeptide--D-alanyl-D-alanine ligase
MSVAFGVRDVVAWSHGELVRGDADKRFEGVSIDTRTLAEGALFFAIRGPRHDAHAFLEDAVRRGAGGLVIERGHTLTELPAALPVVVVDDTTRALGAVAAGHRCGFTGPVVAITGSNGKTTTKEMCAAILAVTGPCLKNRGNLNNAYGLPLTLLEREAEHRALVVEIGMNHRGEIAPLAAIARPSVGVVTNVGSAHIEHLGSREEIAKEKGELVAALEPEATAVLNADDDLVMIQAGRTRARALTFGRGSAADVRAEHVTALGERGFAFDLVSPGGRVAVHLGTIGESVVINSLAAAAAALAAGASLEHVAEGLARVEPVQGRMERIALPRNIIVLDDTYNANPQSMEVALRSLASLKGKSRGIAVLGDMGELGAAAREAHRSAGALAARLGLDYVFALGEHAAEIAEGARGAGMARDRVRVDSDHEGTSRGVAAVLRGNDWVLVKGSRSMRMEKIVESLTRGRGE